MNKRKTLATSAHRSSSATHTLSIWPCVRVQTRWCGNWASASWMQVATQLVGTCRASQWWATTHGQWRSLALYLWPAARNTTSKTLRTSSTTHLWKSSVKMRCGFLRNQLCFIRLRSAASSCQSTPTMSKSHLASNSETVARSAKRRRICLLTEQSSSRLSGLLIDTKILMIRWRS